MPLSRHRCVESPHPTNSAPIKLYRFRGRLYPPALRTFSLFTFTYYFERSETTPSASAHSAPVLLQVRQYRKTAAHGSILGRLRLLFFYAVKNLFRRLRVGGYLVAERIERIEDPFGSDISEQFYFDIFSVEVAGEVGYAGLTAQIVACK